MRKKNLLVLLIFLISFISFIPVSVSAEAKETDITSAKYGSQFSDTLSFDIETCKKDYKEFNKQIKNSKEEQDEIDQKYNDQIGSGGIAGKLSAMLNSLIIELGYSMSNLITSSSCILGFAPSQLLQMMFFPIVLDNFGFLDELSVSVQTISIVTLVIITVMAILELNNKQGSITEEIVSKTGSFVLATGIIAFSTFALQGIYDIANVLGYYVSNYEVSILIDPGKDIEVFEDKETGAILDVNLLNFPMIFVSFLEFALSPELLSSLPTFNLMMTSILTIVKIMILFFMTKDLLRIAVYGIKRMITLVSAAIVMPVLAALIPSYKTKDIFYKYFRNVVAASFAPILFGLIYLTTAPFIIENLIGMIQAPLLKVIVLAFYLNILASIPDTVDGMIGSANALGNQRFERGMDRMQFGSSGSFKKEFQGLNRHHKAAGGKSPISTVGSYTKQKAKGAIYGMRKR